MSILRPKVIDRYYINYFERMVFLAIGSVIFVFILVNFFERLDNFMAKKSPPGAIVEFYLYQIPYLFVLLLPVAGLLASFFSIGESARKNEVLVLVTSGVSLYRLFSPFIVLGVIHSAIAFKVGDSVAPEWTRKARVVKALKIEHKKKLYARNFARNLSFWSIKRELFFFGALDARTNEARNVTVIEFRGKEIERRLDALKANFNGEYWVFSDVTERTFDEQGKEKVRLVSNLEERNFTIEPREFLRESRELEEMSLAQLRERVMLLKDAGIPTTEEEVEIQVRYSFPLANLIILLFALPLAVSQRGHGRTYGFGFSVILSFFYWTVLQFSKVIGQSGRIPPFWSAWIPNLLFLALGFVAIMRTRK